MQILSPALKPRFCSRPHPGDVGAALGVAGPQSYNRTLPTRRAFLPVAGATFTLPPLGPRGKPFS